MEVVLLFAAGFAPGAFWLWYFYRKDRYEREPHGLVLRTAFFGVLCAIPVSFIEMPFENFFIAAVIVAPIVEEFAKFAVVRWTIYHNPEFDEPMDGVVYAAAAALGFASIENVGYIANHYMDKGVGAASGVFVARALLSVPGHVLFSSLWGYALGRAKFQPAEMRRRTILLGLGLAMAGHALFNLFLIVGLAFAVVFLLLPYLWRRFNRNVDELLSGSPFRGTQAGVAVVTTGDEKAHEFFLAGSPQLQSDTQQLPPVHSETHTEENLPATIPNDDIDRATDEREMESEDHPYLESHALPSTMGCVACGRNFELSVAERNRGWFYCTGCKYFNAARMQSGLLALIGEDGEGPVQFILKPFVICPSCKSELHLEPRERAEGDFICTACGVRSEPGKPGKERTVKEFILPAEGNCPECDGNFVIEEFYRNRTSFSCPACGSTIEYVEE